MIDWSGSCGNLSAAVAVWAIEEGLVNGTQELKPYSPNPHSYPNPYPHSNPNLYDGKKEPSESTVRIFNANHGKVIEAKVPTSMGAPEALQA